MADNDSAGLKLMKKILVLECSDCNGSRGYPQALKNLWIDLVDIKVF